MTCATIRVFHGVVSAVAIVVSMAGPPGFATSTTDDAEVRRTWDAANLSVVYGDITAFGELASGTTREMLATLPSDARIPTKVAQACML